MKENEEESVLSSSAISGSVEFCKCMVCGNDTFKSRKDDNALVCTVCDSELCKVE